MQAHKRNRWEEDMRNGLMRAAFAALALMTTAATAADWRYSSWTPPLAPNNAYGSIPLIEALLKESKGTFKVQNFMGAQLFNNITTLAGIRDGAVDAGVTVPVFNSAELKTHDTIADMQALTRDGFSAAMAGTEMVLLNCPECLAEYDRQNTITLGTYAGSNFHMMCNFEIKSVDDLKGKKVAGGSAMHARLAKALGQTRIQLGPGDYLQSLSNRQVDCAMGPREWLLTYGLKDAVKSVAQDQGFGAFFTVSLVTVNKNSWKKLTEQERALLLRLVPASLVRTTIGINKNDDRGIQVGREKGVKFVDLGPGFKDTWRKFQEAEVTSVIESAKGRGVAHAERIVKKQIELFKKWEAIVDRIGPDEAKLTQALNDEVYSKVKF
jgi:TRAP-type C4-dicarboxylate transport system substrate-binding protein